MNRMLRLRRQLSVIGAAAFAAALVVSQATLAATVVCPPSTAGGDIGDREMTLTTASASECVDTGQGNNVSDPDFQSLIASLGVSLIEEVQVPSGDGTFLDVDTAASPKEFTLTGLSGYTNLLLVFKFGNAGPPSQPQDPDWFAWLLPDGTLSGTYTINFNENLSHASIYGTPIPIPPAALLFLSGLFGLGVLGRRRRQKPAQG